MDDRLQRIRDNLVENAMNNAFSLGKKDADFKMLKKSIKVFQGVFKSYLEEPTPEPRKHEGGCSFDRHDSDGHSSCRCGKKAPCTCYMLKNPPWHREDCPEAPTPKECECVCHEAYDGTDGYCKYCPCDSAAEREKHPTPAFKEPTEEKCQTCGEKKILRDDRGFYYCGDCGATQPPKEPECTCPEGPFKCYKDDKEWQHFPDCPQHERPLEGVRVRVSFTAPDSHRTYYTTPLSEKPELLKHWLSGRVDEWTKQIAWERAQEKQPHFSSRDSDCTCCWAGKNCPHPEEHYENCPVRHGRAR